MRVLFFAACLALASASAIRFDMPDTLGAQWEEFKATHKKTYPTEHHEKLRRSIFEENLRYIQRHNFEADMGRHSFRLGMNAYGDLTNAEFRRVLLGLRVNATRTEGATFLPPANLKMPTEVDWRTKGYVTPVKNQGQCGSCWAFSTTGSLEGQHYRKTGQLVSLSEQNLVDCSTRFGNNGCGGGLMDNAFKYIKANGGIDTESSYPYMAQNGNCHFKKQDVGATDTGFVDVVPRGSEEALQSASASVGPISVAIDASHTSFQLYRSGVYVEPECSQQQLDHGVLVVGYGTDNGDDYWLVKNSWGETWGLNGYIKMARNKDNQCGIASMASYPLV